MEGCLDIGGASVMKKRVIGRGVCVCVCVCVTLLFFEDTFGGIVWDHLEDLLCDIVFWHFISCERCTSWKRVKQVFVFQ